MFVHWSRVEQGRGIRVGVGNMINPRSFVIVMIREVPCQFPVLVLRMTIQVEGLCLVLEKM